MKAAGSGNDSGLLNQLEKLIDELIKDNPEEGRIRTYMEEAGLCYTEDPIERMHSVLSALKGVRGSVPNSLAKKRANKGGGHDRSI